MRLSELRKVLENAQEVAQRLGNQDPEITFWHKDQEVGQVYEVDIHPDLRECLVLTRNNLGNFSFQLKEIDL